MMKFLMGLVLLVVLLAAGLVVFKDAVVKAAVEIGVTKTTGFYTKIEKLDFDFPKSIQISGLRIHNPEGFEEKIFLDAPEIYISVVLKEALKKEKIHLPEVRLNVQQVNIVKNKDGISNVQMLTSVGGQGAKPAAKPAEPKPAMPFQLDKLVLTMRQVQFYDPSGLPAGLAPKNLSVDMNVNQEVFTDITDPKALINLILTKIFYGTTFGKLMGLSPDLLENSLKGGIATGQKLITTTGEAVAIQAEGAVRDVAGQVTAQTPEALKSAANQATSVLGGAGSTAKDQVSGVFGKLKSTVTAEKTSQ